MRLLLLFATFVIILMTSSCSRHYSFTTKPIPNKYYTTPELREVLQRVEKPSVVLRVPYTTTLTESEGSKIKSYNSIYNLIERKLIGKGYTVRDRSLLNTVLEGSERYSYEEIAEKIDTDIIIEIINIEFDKELFFHEKFMKKGKEKIYTYPVFDNKWINAPFAKFDFKIILTNKGMNGGIYTFYHRQCGDEEGCSIKIKGPSGTRISTSAGKYYHFEVDQPRIISFDYNDETIDNVINNFVNQLLDILAGK